jgi:hypothetical protein
MVEILNDSCLFGSQEIESMGLDMVELHMAIEDHFGIRLPINNTFPATVGEVFDAIKLRMERAITRTNAGACACIPVFFEVRDVLGLLSTKSQRIRPSTRLDQVLPRSGMLDAWGRLEATLQTRLPSLSPPKDGGAVVLGWLGVVTIVELLCFLAFDVAGIWLASFLFVPIATWLLFRLNARMPRPLPPGICTVRDLVYLVMPSAAVKTRSTAEGPLWEQLVTIVSNQLDVPRELIRPESHFVRDLLCD